MGNAVLNLKEALASLGLSLDNAVVIGSGILSALDIRESGDVDVVIDDASYERLSKTGQFTSKEHYGRPVLENDVFEISTRWSVLGKDYKLTDLAAESVIIHDVRYVTLDFLLRVKRSWLSDDAVRQKDVEDVKLIEAYLAKEKDRITV